MPPTPCSSKARPSPMHSALAKPRSWNGRKAATWVSAFLSVNARRSSHRRIWRHRPSTNWSAGRSPWPGRFPKIHFAASPNQARSRRTIRRSIFWIRSEPAAEELIDRAKRAEDAARAVDGVTNSEGAEANWSVARVALVASNGFSGEYGRSGHSTVVSVLAGEGTSMERDYDWSSSVFADDLESPEALGRSAGERAVRRLNPRKVKSTRVPVVYDPRVSGGLIGHLASAINGAAIARGTSFLKDSIDQTVFADGVSVIDDARRKRGLRSKPFDGEGIATSRRPIIDGGRLTTWILDLRSGSAARPRDERPCIPRHLRPAQPVSDQSLSRTGPADTGRPDRRNRRRLLHNRDDRLRRRQHHRRLQPRCRRLLDREG